MEAIDNPLDDLTASAVAMLALLPGPPVPGNPGATVCDLAVDLFGADRPDNRKRVRRLRQDLLRAHWAVDVVRCPERDFPLKVTYCLTSEALERAHKLIPRQE